MSNLKPKLKPDLKPKLKPDLKPKLKPDLKPKLKPDLKPVLKPVLKPDLKPKLKPDLKPVLIPDLKFYYSTTDLVFDVLATCAASTEYAAGNLPIYAKPNLTGLIGYMQQKYIQDGQIFKFEGDILFLPFNGTLSYYAIYTNTPYPFKKEITFINTILSGSGDLANTSGKVVTYVNPEESEIQTVYIFFDKKN